MAARHNRLAAVLPIALAALLLAGCSAGPSFESELDAAIDGADGELVLSSLDSVEGSSFLVVCPYDNADSITDRLGFDWPEAPDYSATDDRQTIAVIENGAVSTRAELPRDTVDFCSAGPWQVLPTDSILTVTPTDAETLVTAPR